MSAEKMIQLGSNLYALPSDVVRVYKTDPTPSLNLPDGTVYVVLRNQGVFGGEEYGYRNTDWPIDRVVRALGLADGTEMHKMMEAE